MATMKDVVDRVPTYPGRVKMTPVPGQANTYDMERADQPLVVGTPIDKALFDSFTAVVQAAMEAIDNKIFELSQRVEYGNLSEGSVFGLYENGALVPYIKLRENYNNSGRALSVRRDIVTMMGAYTEAQQYYPGCDLDAWLESEFIARFDPATQGALIPINVNYNGSVGIQTIQRKVFPLSLHEYGYTDNTGIPNIGSNIPYFNNAGRRVANFNGTPTAHHTRSNDILRATTAIINADGTYSVVNETTVAGVRPALTLPPTFTVTAGVNTSNTLAGAEVIP